MAEDYNNHNEKEEFADFIWFEQRYDEFAKQYGDCWLAIKNEKILGVYQNQREAWDRTIETEEPGTFIIQEVSTSRLAYVTYIASFF